MAIPKLCSAQFGFGGGVEVHDSADILANITQIARLVEEIQLINSQLQDMLKNSRLGGATWTSQLSLLLQLGNVLQRGNGLAYSLHNIDERFLTTFPGYQPPKDWHDDYGKWTTTSLDTLRNVLSSLGVQADNIAWDASRIAQLAMLNTSPAGRNVAIQVGNSIGLEAIGQIQRLKEVSMAQSNAYAVIEGRKLNQAAQQEAQAYDFWKKSKRPIPAYGSSGLGVSTFAH